MISSTFVWRHANKIIFAAVIGFTFQGCSSSSDDMDEAEVSASADGDKSASPPDSELDDKIDEVVEKAPAEQKTEVPATEVPAEVEGETPAATHAAPAAPAPAVSAPSDGSRIVRYVSAKSATLRDQPSSKGKKVGTATRGDHFLVTIQGQWAQTDDGKFIETKFLSEQPIGKKKRGAGWK